MRLVALLMPLLVLSTAVLGRAEGLAPPPKLEWRAPEGCPGQPEVEDEIDALIGRAWHQPGTQRLEFNVEVQKTESAAYELVLRVLSAQGTQTRALSDDDCSRLTKAGSLIIALTIDPERLVRHARGKPSDALPAAPAEPSPSAQPVTAPPAPEAAVNSEATLPASSSPRPGHRERIRGSAAVMPVISNGPLHFGFAVEARLAARFFRRYRVELVGDLFWPQTDENSPYPPAKVGVRLRSLGLRGCWAPDLLGNVLAACVGPQVGDMQGFGRGVNHPREPHQRWSALLLGLSAEKKLGWLLLTAGLEGGPSLERPRFGVNVDGQFHGAARTEAWIGQAWLGVGVASW